MIPEMPSVKPALPELVITLDGRRVTMKANVAPSERPLLLWMLEQAKLTVLTGLADEELPKLVKPNGFPKGLLGRMRPH